MSKSRRQHLRDLTVIGSIAAITHWQKPVVKSIILPSHAITTDPGLNIPLTIQLFDAAVGNGFDFEFLGDPTPIPVGSSINILFTSVPNSSWYYSNFLNGNQIGNSTLFTIDGFGRAAFSATISSVSGDIEILVVTLQAISEVDPTDNQRIFIADGSL